MTGLQAGHRGRYGRVRGGQEEQKVRQDSGADPAHRQHHERRNQERAVGRIRHQLFAESKI